MPKLLSCQAFMISVLYIQILLLPVQLKPCVNASYYIAGLLEVTVVSSSRYVEVTSNVTFTAIASGVGMEDFTYQWRHNAYPITNKTGATLTIVNAMEGNNGFYVCVVTNIYGNTVSSNPVILIVSSKFIV